jgi:hypothetical protein
VDLNLDVDVAKKTKLTSQVCKPLLHLYEPKASSGRILPNWGFMITDVINRAEFHPEWRRELNFEGLKIA